MTMADWDQDNPSAYIPAYPMKAQFIIAGPDGNPNKFQSVNNW